MSDIKFESNPSKNSRRRLKLPDTICGLYNLSTLRLVCCSNLTKLPENMGNLINLKHLYVDGCGLLKSFPKVIGRLTSLQTLDVCSCGGDKDEEFQIGDLRNLNLEGRQTNSAEILNALRPHPDLESLRIWSYNGTMWPNWIQSLHNLRFLTVRWGTPCELWPLGKLECLERLVLYSMEGVKKVGVEFLGLEDQTSFRIRSPQILFPKLKQLHFYNMSNWEEWEGVEEWTKEDSEITIMPCLSELRIGGCELLKALPDFIFKTPLQTLASSDVGDLQSITKKAMESGLRFLLTSAFTPEDFSNEYERCFDLPNLVNLPKLIYTRDPIEAIRVIMGAL
ncbi:NB-ARC domain-containing disease resistance protein [Prunus dulcis]|uniref:NB-ARC domain-containing disease resistance protein n=1 Tax=Prunus dulcis TaxID=3755 RepID=A0A5H2Y8F2_PRUDU|nr:NB-ARC domain-containing disease resistance protein [Prunus dulcis]